MEAHQIVLSVLLCALVLLGGLILLAWLGRGPEDTPFIAFLRVVNTLLARGVHRLSVRGNRDAIPAEGPCIVVANHRSGVDPNLIAGVTSRWIVYLMAREYYETPTLHWLFHALHCIPVRRDGSDLGATRAALKALRSGRVIGIFPQGGIRDPDDDLGIGKAGVALLAARSGAPVVPLFIDGSPAIDSVYLSVLRPSRSRIYCGEPLSFPSSDHKPKRKELEDFTARILGELSDLRSRARQDDPAEAVT